MFDDLRQATLRYTSAHGEADGVATTPVAGLYLVQRTACSEIEHTVARPLVCRVLQGRKEVAIGRHVMSYGAGDTMIVTGSVPTASRIVQASVVEPYLSMALDLNPALITDLILGAPDDTASSASPHADRDLGDALRRLVLLLDRPHSLAVLKDALIGEIHHWLLMGRQGAAIRNLGLPDSHARRIARAVALLRADCCQPLPIERLAAAAGMSRSAFHQHFRAITSMSPLQFQKSLRLIEARRLVLSEGRSLSQVAFDVGYASSSQFSREYARMYGQPPSRDKQAAERRRRAAGAERGTMAAITG
ncbi:AraC family transcriptional regulator [Variovorax sp. PAMC 28711]|uniref:AraC family transcriptional regulator n=1 Tax=Variovorax sp. PAMC 28711 TaxID=1795631 RepID=UPI00078DC322|nr:AraC family transcriptional regulator [Variovorax sp. PAMC 28711]AMM24507.1 AraC family transcriptional regulator [Variovorax sp. PAMC 28711]